MPPFATPTRPPQVVPLLNQAAHWLKAGRPSDAIVPLREASRRLPGDAAILHDLGLACLATTKSWPELRERAEQLQRRCNADAFSRYKIFGSDSRYLPRVDIGKAFLQI